MIYFGLPIRPSMQNDGVHIIHEPLSFCICRIFPTIIRLTHISSRININDFKNFDIFLHEYNFNNILFLFPFLASTISNCIHTVIELNSKQLFLSRIGNFFVPQSREIYDCHCFVFLR